MSEPGQYFLPQPSQWPVVGSMALLLLASGAAVWLNGGGAGPYVLATGGAIIVYVLFGWFGNLIGEGRRGSYDDQVEGSFRSGMAWFIYSEMVVFAALFAALFYVRVISVPGLASGDTHTFLWPEFHGGWPASGPMIEGSFTSMRPWPIPTINTLLLLTSGLLVTLAHAALDAGRRGRLIALLSATIVLGLLFLRMQASEYHHAYTALNLTLATGAYGATFFVLTGLHGLHVAIGSIFLMVTLTRIVRGDFTVKHHLGFQAATWYWHFVGVVWLILYVLVYWL
jgi:cytochrome c oxidase subunit III